MQGTIVDEAVDVGVGFSFFERAAVRVAPELSTVAFDVLTGVAARLRFNVCISEQNLDLMFVEKTFFFILLTLQQ